MPSLSKLPPELRIIIWRMALDQALRPALFPYKRGCWNIRMLVPGEWEYDYTIPDVNLILEFQYELLCEGQLDVPVASVNAEAHCVAVEWARTHPRIRYCTTENRFSFLRSFDPDHDALFVTKNERDDCLAEFMDQPSGQFYSCRPRIGNFAIPESSLPDVVDEMADLLDMYSSVGNLYIVKDDQTTRPIPGSSDGNHPRLRECESLQKVATWRGSHWTLDLTRKIGRDDEFRKLVKSLAYSLGVDRFDRRYMNPHLRLSCYSAILVENC
ncbi:hypothetical protein GGR57DRAFT_474300 [Xylariaceae sp. FL1272]|nr:hypothetical protein GGR57DRAFT_474300 [Xylariaceae sp. FL1272]